MPTITAKRVFKAMPLDLDDGTTVIELNREIVNMVKDKAGRELYSHPQYGRQERTELDTLTLAEAGQLLRDLADVITFLLTNRDDA